jgi:hypothetical protein
MHILNSQLSVNYNGKSSNGLSPVNNCLLSRSGLVKMAEMYLITDLQSLNSKGRKVSY